MQVLASVQSPISEAFQSFIHLNENSLHATPEAIFSTSPQTALSLSLTLLHTQSSCKRKAVIYLNTTT